MFYPDLRPSIMGVFFDVFFRALLGLSVIRNEGAHLGLLRYDRATIVEMIESMAMASLMIWRAR